MTMSVTATAPLLALVALAAITAGVACGPPATTVNDASSDNPCLLVSSAEIQAVLGSAVGGPVTENVAPTLVGERLCQFQTADPARPSVLLKLGVVSSYAESVFDKYKGANEVRPVESLDAPAVWDATKSILLAKKEAKVLTVLVFGPGVKDHRAKATKLAERALERL